MELIFEPPGRNPNAVRMLCLFLHVGMFLPDLLLHEAITTAASRSNILKSPKGTSNSNTSAEKSTLNALLENYIKAIKRMENSIFSKTRK